MHIKNSQIRAQARHLLDDNIFGKDWTKGALVHILIDAIIFLLGYALVTFTGGLIVPLLLTLVGTKSKILVFAIPILFYLADWILICLITGPIGVGKAAVYLDLVRGEGDVRIRKFFYGFRHFVDNFIIGVMYMLQVLLWALFFIVPGVYVAYSYALVFYVKRDHPTFKWKQCFDESERLMEGRRWQLFKLQISHIGWFIIGTTFVFIGTYWAEPYLETSTAVFYEEAKRSR